MCAATCWTAGSRCSFRRRKQTTAGSTGSSGSRTASEAGTRCKARTSCTTGAGGEGARGVHRSTRSGTGAGHTGAWCAGTRTLKDGTASRSSGGWRRCGVGRTRASLRHDDAAHGNFGLGGSGDLRRGRLGSWSWSWCSRRSGRRGNGSWPDYDWSRRRNGGDGRTCGTRNNSAAGAGRCDDRRRSRGSSGCGRDKCRTRASLRHHTLGSNGLCRSFDSWCRLGGDDDTCGGGSSGFGGRGNGDSGGSWPGGWRGLGGSLSLFALEDELESIAGFADAGEVDRRLSLGGCGFCSAGGAGALGQ